MMIGIPVDSGSYSSLSDASYINKKEVKELYKQMKEQSSFGPRRSVSNAGNLTSLCVDISPSLSNFFEVLYIGKIKLLNKNVGETFIDDALEKFKIHEIEKDKAKLFGNIGRLKSQESIRRGSTDSNISESGSTDSSSFPRLQKSLSVSNSLGLKPEKIPEDVQEKVAENKNSTIKVLESNNSASSDGESSNEIKENYPKPKEDIDHNRTMVLQVDRTVLRLISPDQKMVLLHKHHTDVTTCLQGLINGEHFGFICKEANNPNFTGYIFKCESASIAVDAVAAITQAFTSSEAKTVPTITSCDHCPMVWYHKLCTEIEHTSDQRTQAAIFKRIEQLDDEEQQTILTKLKSAETDSIVEQNEFLMMLLRVQCEMKQSRHVHDTAENRSEFLNQYLGGGKIFMKAKRSLSNSFDLLKKKASREDFASTLNHLNLSSNRESSPHSPASSVYDQSDKDSEGIRSRSSTIGSQSDLRESTELLINKTPEKNVKSPMMDIFLKVGSSKASSFDEKPIKEDHASWRQAMFKKVTPTKVNADLPKKRTKEELRSLWLKSIHQTILLIRMEKENARIKAKQEESAVKRIKLEYDEMKPNQREIIGVWEMVTSKEGGIKCDKQMLLQAVRQGVPRGKRGEVWHFLAEQHCMKAAPIDTLKYPNYNTPYETLLKQLTSHQHAILIDVGRTFPNHSYFSSPLGPGQLALFNLLKAYSLLDPQVGYCQGLSFVVGVLLLHMEESQAFFLLRHLMFRRGLRKQYLPDMTGLHVRLYQLSRLLHDHLPDLSDHFSLYDVEPTLFAAPWLLTIFASQFPLGFVTRVFDLLFLEGLDVIFRVALALLSYHREQLLLCNCFEEIMDYLKTTVTAIDKSLLDTLIKDVYTIEISQQLVEYRVEYQVLQEEMQSVQPQVEEAQKLKLENKRLTEQNKALTSQLEMALANVQRLEKTRTLHQAQINRQEMQSRGSEVTIATLGNFINNLVEQKVDVEIPDEVRRILEMISFSERRKQDSKSQNNLMKMFQTANINKQMVKSLSTGKISFNNNLDQSELRSNSLNDQAKENLKLEKTSKSQFFSNTHSNILQEKVHSNPNLLSNTRIDITVQEFENGQNTPDNKSFDSEKDIQPSTSNFLSAESHPLSNCGVNFTYNGTRELKTIKSTRTTHPSNPNKSKK